MSANPVRFEMLIEQYHDEIYRYLWRLLGGAGWTDRDGEAQDLAQDVFMRAYRAFPRLRDGSNHRAWLYKIATNCAYSAVGRNRQEMDRRVSLDDVLEQVPGGAGPSPYQQVVLKETLEGVRTAILELPAKQQAAVVLRHVQELSYAEIAQALACSEDSARANVYQGLRRLRQVLGEEP
jgi:RNA polymerase sigma-70 factor, ECF subfamily